MQLNTPSNTRGLLPTVGAATALGFFSTLGDWIWARFIPDGAVLPGVIHGVLIFVILAMILGFLARSRKTLRRLLLALPVVGLVLAAAFYPLAYAIGYIGALLATWIGMWLALALSQRWARENHETVLRSLVRGFLAAVGSGMAFWAISGIWTDPAAHTSYLLRLAYWTFAFFPGFLALLFGTTPGPTSDRAVAPSRSA